MSDTVKLQQLLEAAEHFERMRRRNLRGYNLDTQPVSYSYEMGWIHALELIRNHAELLDTLYTEGGK